jgi:hypothetical protein
MFFAPANNTQPHVFRLIHIDSMSFQLPAGVMSAGVFTDLLDGEIHLD